MRWLKYLMVCLLTLILFAGGALFSHFIGDIKEILHIEERSHHYTLNIMDTTQIPYEQYESNIILSVPNKAGSSDAERQELANRFSRVLRDVTGHIAKLPLYERGACFVRSKMMANWTALEDKVMSGVVSCTITEKDLEEYKALLKEIDYLALKNGGLRVEMSSPYPVVDFAQIENAKQNLRASLLVKTHQSVEFYSTQTKRHCSLLASSERNAYSPSNVIARALGGGGESYGGVSSFVATFPISSDIKLPLEKSAPLYFEACITIRCD